VTEARFLKDDLDLLRAVPGVGAGWLGRLPEVDVAVERDEALRRLREPHEGWIRECAGEAADWWRPEQVHGAGVAEVPGAAVIEGCDGLPVVAGVDGLVSSRPGVVLTVVVADCGPVWLADRGSGAVGLLHSGKKGTEFGILRKGVELMGERFGTRPSDLVVVLGPCIRPPHYEIDFAAEIGRQAARLGVGEFHDCGCDTAVDPEGCYSYRMEKGMTGRMLAAVWIENAETKG
jgi:copper oxidase (laccase) domain-containing protein